VAWRDNTSDGSPPNGHGESFTRLGSPKHRANVVAQLTLRDRPITHLLQSVAVLKPRAITPPSVARVVLAPAAKRLSALIDIHGATYPEAQEPIARILRIASVDVAMLLVVVVDTD
jgi:hypothetical protein